MALELKNFSRFPKPSSSSVCSNPVLSEAYDKLDRCNERTPSVESGFESTNDGYGVFDDEDGHEKNYEINNTYSSLNECQSFPPVTRRNESYQDFKSDTNEKDYERMYSSTLDKPVPSKVKDRVYPLPETRVPSHLSENRNMIPLDLSQAPQMKKQNILYETSVMTSTQNKNLNGTKISITKQNSLTTSTHTTAPPPLPQSFTYQSKRRKTCCGVPPKHCYLGLNIIFGLCAMIAFIIGVMLVIHEQDRKNEVKYIKENFRPSTNKATVQNLINTLETLSGQVNKVDKRFGSFNNTLIQLVKQHQANSPSMAGIAQQQTFKGCIISEISQTKIFSNNDDRKTISVEVKAVAQKKTTIKGTTCFGTSLNTKLAIGNNNEQSCICTGLTSDIILGIDGPYIKCMIRYWLCYTS